MPRFYPEDTDLHMHSANFSDGFSSVDWIVQVAHELGLKEIAITDHSDVIIRKLEENENCHPYSPRWLIEGWENPHNDLKVRFGVEADVLDQRGNICDSIQDRVGEYLVLSLHDGVYQGDPDKATDGFIEAITRNSSRIGCIGHLCSTNAFPHGLDVAPIVEAANYYGIPLEVNGKNLLRKTTDRDKLLVLLEKAAQLQVNSDAHVLSDMELGRKVGWDVVRDLFLVGKETTAYGLYEAEELFQKRGYGDCQGGCKVMCLRSDYSVTGKNLDHARELGREMREPVYLRPLI